VNLISKFIPSRAAIVGALAAVFAALFTWARHDARRDLTETIEKRDVKNAKTISDRVRSDRADPERLYGTEDAGWRD
jgi:hypothetical protein